MSCTTVDQINILKKELSVRFTEDFDLPKSVLNKVFDIIKTTGNFEDRTGKIWKQVCDDYLPIAKGAFAKVYEERILSKLDSSEIVLLSIKTDITPEDCECNHPVILASAKIIAYQLENRQAMIDSIASTLSTQCADDIIILLGGPS
jgi:hypothetical protein